MWKILRNMKVLLVLYNKILSLLVSFVMTTALHLYVKSCHCIVGKTMYQ